MQCSQTESLALVDLIAVLADGIAEHRLKLPLATTTLKSLSITAMLFGTCSNSCLPIQVRISDGSSLSTWSTIHGPSSTNRARRDLWLRCSG